MQKTCKPINTIVKSLLVPAAGLEPARLLGRGILSPLCLPIPPSGRSDRLLQYINIIWLLSSRAFNSILLLL